MKIVPNSLQVVEVCNGYILQGTTPEGDEVCLAHLGDGTERLPDPHDPDLSEIYEFEVSERPTTCPQCNGNGVLYPGATTGMWNGLINWPIDISGEPCDLCDGSGEVSTQIAEEYEGSVLGDLDD